MITDAMHRMVCQVSAGLSVEVSVLIARIANSSNSRISIEYKGNMYTAHSILKLLSIDMEEGALVTISAQGKDAEEVIRNIGLLLKEDAENASNYSCHPSLV